ncbi:MAG TPA: hypothetical protein VHR66_06360 [Gemmataceae bacterium]|jgi:hypothetical protein|nr:hypothetical protein [Gemmataceae bacterium]
MPMIDLGADFTALVAPDVAKTVAWVRVEPTPAANVAANTGGPYHVAIRFKDQEAALTSRAFGDAATCKKACEAAAKLLIP